jgi:chromosomal replication initiation ATPase DnaA
MNSAAQQYRAHIERQRRLGMLVPPSVALKSAVPPNEAGVIAALRQQVVELSARLQAMALEDESPVAVPTRIKPLISAVAKYYDVPVRDLVSFRRTHALIRPRQVAMYLARALTKHSLPAIGRVFERDHTTILHGCRQIEKQRQRDPDLDLQIRQLIERLTPAAADHTK